MKKKILIIIGVLILFVLMSRESVKSEGSKLTHIKDEISLTHACSYYRLYYSGSLTDWMYDITTIQTHNIKEVYGKLKDLTIEWLVNESNNISVPDHGTCYMLREINTTNQSLACKDIGCEPTEKPNVCNCSYSCIIGYHNETIYSWHWWRLEFTALTNIMDPSVFNVTLWDYDPEVPSREFIAHFKVYWGDTTDNLIWVNDAQGRDGGNYNATAARTFNTSDTWVEISSTGLEGCFHIDALHNVTIFKETYWRLWTNPGEWRYVKVGESLLEFNYTLYHWNSIYLNETDLEHTPNVPTNWEVQYNLTYYADPNAGNDPAGDGKAVFSWFDTVVDIDSLGAGGIVRPAPKPTALDPDGWNWTFANHAYTMLLNGLSLIHI